MSKPPKRSTRKKLPSIFGTTLTRGYLKSNPVTDSMIDYLCEELIEFASSGGKLFLEQFHIQMRIPRKTWYNWLERFPKLAETYEEAKDIMGYLRVVDAANKKFDRTVVMYNQFQFGEKWKEADRYNDERRKKIEEGTKQGTIIVEMKASENTDEVPEKNAKENNGNK